MAERGGLRPRRRERCSSCGAPGRFGQLICLTCGERMALRSRGAPSWRPAALAAAAMVVTAGVAVGLVIDGVNGGGEARPASADQPAAAPAVDGGGAEAAKRASKERARRAIAAAAGDWPASRSGYTVVLVNTGDRGSAERFAQTVSGAGESAGVLAADDHPALGTGLFLVFVGVYEDQAGAAAAAARLGESYPGAYTQFVESSSRKRSARPSARGF